MTKLTMLAALSAVLLAVPASAQMKFVVNPATGKLQIVDVGVQGLPFSNTPSADGQVPTYVQSTGRIAWTLPPGAGGGTSGSGTANTLAKWVTTSSIGNSLVSESGSTVTVNGILNLPAAQSFTWATRGALSFSADGRLLVTDSAGTGFTRLMLGGTTSSYPALARSLTELQAKLADDSAFAPVRASGFIVDGATGTNCLLANGTTAVCGAVTASAVANTPAGAIAATNVQSALNELDSEKQPLNANLTTIGGLSCPDGQLAKRVSGAWACADDATSAGGTTIEVRNNNVSVGTTSVVDFVPDTYLSWSVNTASGRITAQAQPNTALLATKATVQAGTPIRCQSTAAGSAHTCAIDPVVTSHTDQMMVSWRPNSSVNGAQTLDIGPGAVSIKKIDGSDPGTSEIISGRDYILTKKASSWTVLAGIPSSGSSSVTHYIPLLIGVCTPGGGNMGLNWTYAGTNAASTSCQGAWTGSGASDRLTLLYNTANMVSYAHWGVPSGVTGGAVTLKFFMTTGTTTTPTFQAAVACIASGVSTSGTPLTFSSPVTVTFTSAFGSSATSNLGTASITNADILPGRSCWTSLTRTDANGGNHFVVETWMELQ